MVPPLLRPEEAAACVLGTGAAAELLVTVFVLVSVLDVVLELVLAVVLMLPRALVVEETWMLELVTETVAG